MKPTHPLLARLLDECGYPLLDAGNLDAFCDAPGDAVIFCAGDPVQHAECLDVAVVLPELMRTWPGRFRAALADTSLEPALQARYGFTRWPSLVFLRGGARGGAYVGTLSGIKDWAVYLARIQELLISPPSRPPSVGIAVNTTAHAATCH